MSKDDKRELSDKAKTDGAWGKIAIGVKNVEVIPPKPDKE